TVTLISSYALTPLAAPYLYPLSLHAALPISGSGTAWAARSPTSRCTTSLSRAPISSPRRTGARSGSSTTCRCCGRHRQVVEDPRSEEHTSELQSRRDLVCRLLLEKQKDYLTL